MKIEFFFLFQTPFSFGMNHRTPPYPAGDYCLLCRSERKDSSFLESGVKTSSKLALSMAPKGNSVLHLPLWVCPDCRRTVEKEERHGGLDQPVSGCQHERAHGSSLVGCGLAGCGRKGFVSAIRVLPSAPSSASCPLSGMPLPAFPVCIHSMWRASAIPVWTQPADQQPTRWFWLFSSGSGFP